MTKYTLVVIIAKIQRKIIITIITIFLIFKNSRLVQNIALMFEFLLIFIELSIKPVQGPPWLTGFFRSSITDILV